MPKIYENIKRKEVLILRKLELKKLKITNYVCLPVEFCGQKSKENEEFLTRNELRGGKPCGCSEVFYNKDILDADLAREILEYFVPICDAHQSPQGLFKDENEIPYKTLILDYANNDKEFDEVIKKLCNFVGEEIEEDSINLINSICVSYPEVWDVEIEDNQLSHS